MPSPARFASATIRKARYGVEGKAKELRNSRRGLDWLSFFVADVQTGFGPFVAIYLAAQAWSDAQIGLALSVGSVTLILGRVPAGAIVDLTTHKRVLALISLLAITASALILAIWPVFWPVMAAQLLFGFAACLLVPVLTAISLALVGRGGMSKRLGRNGSFQAAGNALAAGAMGLVGTYLSLQAVFWLTAALTLPALVALFNITRADIKPRVAAMRGRGSGQQGLKGLLLDRGVLVFAACCLLFTLSNAAMLPLASTHATREAGTMASLIVAAGVAVSQGVNAVMAPIIGRVAESRGRRIALMIGLSVLPIRGVLLALLDQQWSLIAIQALDGVSAAMLAVMVPLVAADVTKGTNRLNLCVGIFGLAVGIGATISTTLAGVVATWFGSSVALLGLAAVGAGALALALVAMPETRDRDAGDEDPILQ